jgi:hypothetical protein
MLARFCNNSKLVVGIVGFCLTRNPYFLLFITPSFFMPLVRYLVPMDEQRFKIKMRKIEMKAQAKMQRNTATQLGLN